MSEEQTPVEETGGSTEDAPEVIDLNPKEEPEEEVQEPQAELEDSGSDKPEKGKKKDAIAKMQERITHLTSEKLSERHARQKAEAELKKYQEMAGSKPTIPDVSQYQDEYGETDVAAYNEAMAGYHENLIAWHDTQKTMTQAEQQEQVAQQTMWEQFNQAAEPVRAKYSDFDDVIQRPVFDETLSNILIENQMAEVAYYLGTNEKEALRLRNMTPLQMSKELGKIEGKLLSMPSQSSKAPEPITPVDDAKGASLTDTKMSDDDWLKKAERERLQKIKEKLGAV